MPDNNYRTHSNKEPIRKCPYCSWEGASRGLTFHVLNKSDDEHGEKYDLPDDFDASEAEIVGHEDVEVEMPDKYDIDERLRYVCDYCGKICRGEGGLSVHLNHLSGDEIHPENASNRDPDSFPTFKVEEDGKLVPEDDESIAVATGGVSDGDTATLNQQDVVPVEELEALRDSLMDEEEIAPSEIVERVDEILNRYQ
jgi:hypothetical protein